MKRYLLIFVVLTTVLTACGSKAQSSPEIYAEEAFYAGDSVEMEMPASAPMESFAESMDDATRNSAGTSG